MLPCRMHEIQDVLANLIVHENVADLILGCNQFGGGGHGANLIDWMAFLESLSMRPSSSSAGITQLRRIMKRSSWVSGSGNVPSWSHRVSRGKDQERGLEACMFGHRPSRAARPSLPEGPIAWRRGAVNFIGEHDLSENGTGAKFEFAGLRIEDRYTGDIGGEQIGRALQPLEAVQPTLLARARANMVLATPGTSSRSK